MLPVERLAIAGGYQTGELEEPRGRVLAQQRGEIVIAGLATETSEPLQNRHEGLSGPVLLQALAASEPEAAARGNAFHERVDQRGLPDAGIAGDDDDLTLAGNGTR
jgi:hypothetical protein